MSDKYNKEEPSVLQKIQNQTGCLLLIIGVAMLAFVLTDLLSSGQSIFGGQSNSVGSISGEEVTYEEFDARYTSTRNAIMQNNPGIRFDEFVAAQYRQQIWDLMVNEKVQTKEYKALGLDVSIAEWEDITIGANTHPQIKQSFTDPESGEFNKDRLISFLQNEVPLSDDKRRSWNDFQEQFTRQLVSDKYLQLIGSSFYATDLDARNIIKAEGQSYNAKVVGVVYSNIADSTVTVTDSDIEAYIEDHAAEYEKDETRDIEFISLRVVPSHEDSMAMLDWAADNVERFKNAKDDSAYVANMNSNTLYTGDYKTRGTFTDEIEEDLFAAEIGSVLGPYQKDGIYSLFKVSGTGTDSVRSRRASTIVFRVQGGTDEDTANAIKEARDLISKINRGETTFEAEASVRNFDASRTKGGDMGWIREGNTLYPKSLINAIMRGNEGSMSAVKTNRGIYIVKPTSSVSRKTVQVAVLDQSLFASTKTDGEYYRRAGEFMSKAKAMESFEEAAESMGLVPRIAPNINEQERRVSGINNGNIVARWLFDPETSEGDVSGVLDIDGTYVVAKLTKIHDAGLPEVDEVRAQVENLARNEKKAAIIVPKFEEALKQHEDAESLARAMETIVVETPAVNMNTSNLPYLGQDNVIVGTILGTPAGKRSPIVKGDNAVAVVYVENENQAEITNLEQGKRSIEDIQSQALDKIITEALMDKAEVKDQRYKYYD